MEKKSDKKDPKAHQSKLSKKTEKTKDKKEDNDFQEEIKKKINLEHVDFHQAKCFAVNSGDSITVVNDKAEQIRIFLANLKAPNLAKPNSSEQDEPWAFQAKEFLRKILVGRVIKCEYAYSKITLKDERQMNFDTVYHTVDNQKSKDFGIEKCVNVELCLNGFAKATDLKRSEIGKASKQFEEMKKAETEIVLGCDRLLPAMS